MVKVSLLGSLMVLRMVGMKAQASMSEIRMIETVGSLVRNQGMMAARAAMKKILSERVTSLVPFLKARMVMMMTMRLVMPVPHEPAPPPEVHWPRKARRTTMDQVSQVKRWGFVFPFQVSRIYGVCPIMERRMVMRPRVSFTRGSIQEGKVTTQISLQYSLVRF